MKQGIKTIVLICGFAFALGFTLTSPVTARTLDPTTTTQKIIKFRDQVDEIRVVGDRLNITPENIKSLINTGTKNDLLAPGGIDLTMLDCHGISWEVNGSMAYAMRCLIQAGTAANQQIVVSGNLRVYLNDNDFWRGCNVSGSHTQNLDAAGTAQFIEDMIDQSCNTIAAASTDLNNGTAIIDVWSTESSLICLDDVGAFAQLCSAFSWMAVSH